MPPSKKRRTAQATVESTEPSSTSKEPTDRPVENPSAIGGADDTAQQHTIPQVEAVNEETQSEPVELNIDVNIERAERFRALKLRAQKSAQNNIKAAAAEVQRQATDPTLLTNLQRKKDFASHNLLKADTEAAGEDFERKRAWDWTVEESEQWDKRMDKKARHRDDVAFQDYTQDARKIYKRQLRDMAPDVEAYEKQKAAAIQKAAASGSLEIVETDDGELVAVDRNGVFYSTADSTEFVHNKPEKAAVDRLVKDMQKAEDTRLRKRKERGRANDDDGDVTYINDKNKQFNQKLARFYNKYTAEIRDSFERGTMI